MGANEIRRVYCETLLSSGCKENLGNVCVRCHVVQSVSMYLYLHIYVFVFVSFKDEVIILDLKS
jgi:hypothetical protein